MNNSSHVLLTIFTVLAVGFLGFFAGTRFAARRFAWAWNTRSAVAEHVGYGMMGGRQGFVRSGGIRARMGATTGEITKVNGNIVTLKYVNGTTQDITLGTGAVIETISKGTSADLKVGSTIMVSGGGFWNNTQTVIVRP